MRILALMMLMVVGCGGGRSLTEEEKKVVGTYEQKKDGDTFTLVLLDNGNFEYHRNGEKTGESKWRIGSQGKVVYRGQDSESLERTSIAWSIRVEYKIEPNGDLTWVKNLVGPMEKEHQITYKKIK